MPPPPFRFLQETPLKRRRVAADRWGLARDLDVTVERRKTHPRQGRTLHSGKGEQEARNQARAA